MQKPDNLQYCYVDLFRGKELFNKFFNQGIWKENHIPRELQEDKWTPVPDKIYKVWWIHTNPADPADPGIDLLRYVEEDDWTN